MDAGTELTCDNQNCDCQITIDKPCPHGDSHTCGCGHALTPVDAQN